MANTLEQLRSAVGAVIDPELRRPLAELSMIEAVRLSGTSAEVDVLLTIATCPAADHIAAEVEAAALTVPGVESAAVKLNTMSKDQRSALIAQLRPQARTNPFTKDSLTRVIAVTSGKGGVGKSTVTVNLAVTLAEQGFSVGILDADVYGFSIPYLMGLVDDGQPVRPTRLDEMIVPPVAQGVKVISIGMFVENPHVAVAWRGPMLQKTIEQFLTDVYFGDLDFLLLDMPPGTGDAAITVGQQLPHADVLVVTTGQLAASDVAIRSGVLAHQIGQRVIGVVENLCATSLGDGQSLDLFGSQGADRVATELSKQIGSAVPVIARIPLSIDLSQQADTGVPFVQSNPSSATSVAIQSLATAVIATGRSKVGKNLPIRKT